MQLTPKFENEVSIKLISGKTGEIKYDSTKENAISDDFLCPYESIYGQRSQGAAPYCFLLPDGASWSGFIFDRQNPWAPYCISANNSVDNAADNQWKSWNGAGGYTAPVGVLGQTQLFYQWSNLPQDFELRALGLTGWQSQNLGGDIPDNITGAGTSVNLQPTVFVPQTLVVLPSAILIHGRNFGAETPDILQVSYFLSIVGIS